MSLHSQVEVDAGLRIGDFFTDPGAGVEWGGRCEKRKCALKRLPIVVPEWVFERFLPIFCPL